MRYLFLALLVTNCSSDVRSKEVTALAELYPDERVEILPPQRATLQPYPWQDIHASSIRSITKEYFRCRGSSLNPPRIVLEGTKEVQRYYDCSGGEKHSLPLRDGKEFVYPILLELLNEIQMKTNCPVIVTSGHRCPTHQAYIDSSPKASGSKHLIGAQVTFYVQGLEEHPERALQVIFDYYKQDAQKEYATFSRYEKECDTATQPWQNKEVFIKLYKKHEGRDFDNRHPYPYLSIQVRFDREKNERVAVSYNVANQLLRK